MDLKLLFAPLSIPEVHRTKFNQPRLKCQLKCRFYIEKISSLGSPISSMFPFLFIHRNWVRGTTTGHFQNSYQNCSPITPCSCWWTQTHGAKVSFAVSLGHNPSFPPPNWWKGLHDWKQQLRNSMFNCSHKAKLTLANFLDTEVLQLFFFFFLVNYKIEVKLQHQGNLGK